MSNKLFQYVMSWNEVCLFSGSVIYRRLLSYPLVTFFLSYPAHCDSNNSNNDGNGNDNDDD